MTDYFADLTSDLNEEPHALVVGMAAETFPCQSCAGTGIWRGGYREGACFPCGGRGFHKLSPADRYARNKKRKDTIAQKAEAFEAANPGIRSFLSKAAEWSDFARSMLDQLSERNSLSEKQIAAVRSMMAKQAERAAARVSANTKVDVSALEELFGQVSEKGHTSPSFRAEGLTITVAKASSRNAGALYVKDNGAYAGKIAGGVFMPVREAAADVKDRLLTIAADPKAAATSHGKKTGICCCCGRELTDPASVAAGIGPICAGYWGF